MKISREANLFLNKILNDFIPPILRDQRWFGWLITRILYKDKASIFMGFHERAYAMSDAEFQQVYAAVQSVSIDRETDLNRECVAQILENVVGDTVLEVGCGRGYLSRMLAENHRVTAVDVAISPSLPQDAPHITFQEAAAEKLPFSDASFDTVVTTHMLEHVRDFPGALAELRRVCKKRLIVVVPCERPHFYTPNLHLHFFPYRYSFLFAFRPQGEYTLQKAGGDWFYRED